MPKSVFFVEKLTEFRRNCGKSHGILPLFATFRSHVSIFHFHITLFKQILEPLLREIPRKLSPILNIDDEIRKISKIQSRALLYQGILLNKDPNIVVKLSRVLKESFEFAFWGDWTWFESWISENVTEPDVDDDRWVWKKMENNFNSRHTISKLDSMESEKEKFR